VGPRAGAALHSTFIIIIIIIIIIALVITFMQVFTIRYLKQTMSVGYTRFVQKVSGLTTVHEVDKAYGVLTLIVFNTVPFPQLHTSPNVAATVGNILRTPLAGCLMVSSSNFV